MSTETFEQYFKNDIRLISESLSSIDKNSFEQLINDCVDTLEKSHKIVASGLGKNVAICEKFVGTMLSLGLDASFLHTNTAVHGDLGMIREGDLVIVLTKSGSTEESVTLVDLLRKRKNITIWLISFCRESELARIIEKQVILTLKHEGDLWNVVPNHSTTLNLMVLQKLAIELSRRLGLSLEKDFKPNHPGGAIGEKLRNE